MSGAKWYELTPARRQLLWAALLAALILAGILVRQMNRAEETFDDLERRGIQLNRR